MQSTEMKIHFEYVIVGNVYRFIHEEMKGSLL